MASRDHIIDIIIRTTDQTGGALDKVQKKLLKFDESLERMNRHLSSLTQRAYNVTLNLIDRVTQPGSRLNGVLHNMTDRIWRVTLGLNDRATNRVRTLTAQMATLTSKAYTIAVNVKENAAGKLKGMANSALGSTLGVSTDMMAGAGIGYGIYDTIKTYKDFQAQMSTVGAISGATGEDLATLTEKAKEMGATTSFSATEAGKAFEYMAMAGWKTSDMTAGIDGIMNLAAASGEDLGRVSDIVTDALTAFGLQASDSAHFADVLAAASSNSNTNVSMMGDTFKYVAPLAGALKYSVEDVGLAIGLMANAGIKGEQAGTSLRAIMTRLVDPPKDAAAAMTKLGISVKNSDGTMKPFRQTMMELRTAFAGLSDSEKAEMASSLAGQEAMSGFLAIVNGSDADVAKLAGAIDNADGAAKRMADTRLDNLAGDLTLLSSAWESLQLEIMEGKGADFLRGFVQGVQADVEKFTGYIKDGFDISDIARLAMDILEQLKNTFLEFDGVGSILAGGALIGALTKITSKAINLYDKIKDLSKPGGVTLGGGGGSAGGQNVSSMVVHAQSVVVNGRGAAGGNAPAGDIPAGGGASTRSGGRSRLGRIAKGVGGLGTALMLGTSAYDLYTTKKSVDNDRLYAQNNLDEKSKAYLSAQLDPNATPEHIAGAKADYDRALDYKMDVDDTSQKDMNATIGGTAGTVLGTVAGGVIGGPVGAMVGGTLGGMAGQFIGENWDGIKDAASETFEWIANGASEAASGVGEAFSGIGDDIGGALSGIGEWISTNLGTPLYNAFVDDINLLVGAGDMLLELLGELFAPLADWFMETVWTPVAETATEAWEAIGETATEAWDAISEIVLDAWDYVTSVFSAAADWFMETVWTPIAEYAQAAWDYVDSILSAAWDFVVGIFGAAADWFEGTVWQPISSAVDGVYNAISNAFQSAYNFVTSLFSGLAGWFESNVIGPIKSKFSAVSDFIGSVKERGSSLTGLSPKANGGFVTSPTQALIGEAGPEVVIPLSSSRRSRAFDLMQRAWDALGGAPVDADFDDEEAAQGTAVMPVPVAAQGGGNASVNVDGLNISINVNAGNAGTPEEIVAAIRANLGELTDEIAARLSSVLGGIYANQAAVNVG